MSNTHYDDTIWYREKRPDYEELAERVEKILTEILNIEKINYAIIQSRAKSIESFQNRLKELDYSGKELADLAGVRVVGYVRTDVNKIIEIIKNNFEVDEKKINKRVNACMSIWGCLMIVEHMLSPLFEGNMSKNQFVSLSEERVSTAIDNLQNTMIVHSDSLTSDERSDLLMIHSNLKQFLTDPTPPSPTENDHVLKQIQQQIKHFTIAERFNKNRESVLEGF